MSFINGSPLAGMGATPAFDFERPQNEFQTQNTSSDQYRTQQGDGFRNNPIALPISYPNQTFGGDNDGSTPSNYGTSSGSTSDSSFFASIMNSMSNLMQQLSSYFGASSSTGSTAGSGYATGTGTGYTGTTGQTQTAPTENAYTTATASSTGDPHEAFNGTTTQGANVSDKWDSMKSHGDLLDSNSFRGGYQVSTTTTTPNASGVTYNASATVTTHGGNDAVTLNKDGSYQVTENGQNVSLTEGQATQIGHNESVTLNADKSLTIVDTNHQGGSLTTTLSENGNGVDVHASGTNVDLGGYLVGKSDRDANPVAYQQSPSSQQTYAQSPYGANNTQQSQVNQYQQFLSDMQQTPSQYGTDTEPLGAGELEFA